MRGEPRRDSVTNTALATIAAADLKYAYDWQWSPPWPTADTTYSSPWEHETNSPAALGWPGDESWFPDTLYGEPDFGFTGMYMWRQPYNAAQHCFRSVTLSPSIWTVLRAMTPPGWSLRHPQDGSVHTQGVKSFDIR